MDSTSRTPVRLSDVAKAAGVSSATASRALSDSTHKVNAETRQLIRQTAHKMGYRVNPIARALRHASTGSIGMVVPSISNPFFTEMVEAVEHELVLEDLNLYLCVSKDDPDLEARRLQSLTSGSVDGIIVVPCSATGSALAVEDAAQKVPVVQMDRSIPHSHIPWVGVEDRGSVYEVVLHLSDQGVRTFGMVTNLSASVSSRVRTDAAQEYGELLGLKTDKKWLVDVPFSYEGGAGAAERFCAQGEFPDAIICMDDVLAIGLINGLRQCGMSVPSDLLVTGFDGIKLAPVMQPSLTTVRQPLELMAHEAIELLRGGQDLVRAGVRMAFPGTLQIRDSTKRQLTGAPLAGKSRST